MTPADIAARAATELAAGSYQAAQTSALVAIAGALTQPCSRTGRESGLERHSGGTTGVEKMTATPPDADPITFADTCCGKCQFGTCYVDQMTGA